MSGLTDMGGTEFRDKAAVQAEVLRMAEARQAPAAAYTQLPCALRASPADVEFWLRAADVPDFADAPW